MSDIKYNLFLISQGLERNLRIPYISFIEKDYNAAKLYFKAFIEAERRSEEALKQLPKAYVLHKAGGIDKNFTFKPEFIYITDSFQIMNESKYEQINVTQLSINLAGKRMSAERAWMQNRNYSDKIRSVFNGRIIEKQENAG